MIVRGAVGVALALAGFGAWSLVLGYLAGTLALDVALWLRSTGVHGSEPASRTYARWSASGPPSAG